MIFLYSKSRNIFNPGYRKSPSDTNIRVKATINISMIRDYFDRTKIYIPNDNKFLSLIRNIIIFQQEDISNESLEKKLTTHNNVNSRYGLRATPNELFPIFTVDFKIDKPIKVVNIGDDLSEIISMETLDKVNLLKHRILINPRLIKEDIGELSYDRYVSSKLQIYIMEQSFYLAILKLSLLGGTLFFKNTSNKYYLLDMEKDIQSMVRFYYKNLNSGENFLNSLKVIVIGDNSLYDLISTDSKPITRNDYTSIIVNNEWVIRWLLYNRDIKTSTMYIFELINFIKQTDKEYEPLNIILGYINPKLRSL